MNKYSAVRCSSLIGPLSQRNDIVKWIMYEQNKNKITGVILYFACVLETVTLELQDKALPENTKKATKFGLRNC